MMRTGRDIGAVMLPPMPARLVLAVLLAGSLAVPTVAHAQSGAGLPSDEAREANPRGYDDIMDDVNAVIDAMEGGSDASGAAATEATAGATGDGTAEGGAPAGAADTGGGAATQMRDQALTGDGAQTNGAQNNGALQDGLRQDGVPADQMPADGSVPATGSGAARNGRAASAPSDAPSPQPARQGPAQHSPVVVELFTAQGCAACPPADDLLSDLAVRGDVLALSWNVDYWDYLGWPDPFARPAFSKRQKGYNVAAGSRMLFTPQIIVGGEAAINRPRPADLMSAIRSQQAEPDHVAISHRRSGRRSEIELTPMGALPRDIAVRLIRYLPYRETEVQAGENSGRRLGMRNIVAASEILAMWDGRAAMRLTVTLGAGKAADLPGDTRHAILVQQQRGDLPGEIFAAIPLD